MKCELVAALLHHPSTLFLDEPTIGLDVSMQVAIREFIRRYNEQHNATVLLTSHYMEDVVALWCDGSQGLYIHPGIWHEGVFPATPAQSFRDRQGRVHARISCNVAQEFGVFLNVPLAPASV